MPRPVALVEKNGSNTWVSYPGGRPRPLIADEDPRVVVGGGPGPHGHDAIALAQVRHGIDGIDDDVEHGLLEQHAIASNRHPVAAEFQRQPDAADQGVARKQHGDFTNDISQVERRHLHSRRRHHVADPLDDVAGTTAVLHDVVKPFVEVDRRRARLDEALRRLRIGHDGGQGLIQLMRERGRQLAHARAPGHLRNFLPAPLGVQFGSTARARGRNDVGDQPQLNEVRLG